MFLMNGPIGTIFCQDIDNQNKIEFALLQNLHSSAYGRFGLLK